MAFRHSVPSRVDAGDGPVDRTADLRKDVERSGYYPEVVIAGLSDALGGEPVAEYVIHHEPTFERDEIRRHLTVLVMTQTRLVLAHTDEHAPDDLLPEPYTSTTTEAVPLGRVGSVVVTRMVVTDPRRSRAGATEAVLTVGWGAVRRLELEPATCPDPQCDADHGYTGSDSTDDFSLRVSATADGGAAVERLLAFARALSAATSVPAQ
ncbi:DUF5998 family protein [Solicola sp. PLA-1-18]|uniref:DUF5998 family protein n=1 Tax=Solicola sp. PLA-1-18 TaxID=3380532 RepID=UPI003B7755B5